MRWGASGARRAGVPRTVEPADYNIKAQDHLTDVELIDFGECTIRGPSHSYFLHTQPLTHNHAAFFITDPPKQISTPVSLHPPELVFQHNLTSAVDLWNLGSTVCRTE